MAIYELRFVDGLKAQNQKARNMSSLGNLCYTCDQAVLRQVML